MSLSVLLLSINILECLWHLLVLFCLVGDVELNLAFIRQLTQFGESLLVLATIEEATNFLDSVLDINRWIQWINSHLSVLLLRGTVLELLNVLEMDNGWLALELLLHLHTHKVLHLHELVWHHTMLVELLALWVLVLLVENHLHVHVRVHVHTISEAHLVLLHHIAEWVHVLHAIHHWAWLWHLVVHSLSHWLGTRTLLGSSEISVTMSI